MCVTRVVFCPEGCTMKQDAQSFCLKLAIKRACLLRVNPLDMASTFLPNPFVLGARTVRGFLTRERVFRGRSDPLAFSDDILYERHRFSAEGTRYRCRLVDVYVTNATRWSCALTVTQTVCIVPCSFATGTYMHSVGDAENLSKSTVCHALRKDVLALNKLLDMFVVFPGHDFFVLVISLRDYNLLLLTEICSLTEIHFCRKKSQITIKLPFYGNVHRVSSGEPGLTK